MLQQNKLRRHGHVSRKDGGDLVRTCLAVEVERTRR